jgi:hypothetical protein
MVLRSSDAVKLAARAVEAPELNKVRHPKSAAKPDFNFGIREQRENFCSESSTIAVLVPVSIHAQSVSALRPGGIIKT